MKSIFNWRAENAAKRTKEEKAHRESVDSQLRDYYEGFDKKAGHIPTHQTLRERIVGAVEGKQPKTIRYCIEQIPEEYRQNYLAGMQDIYRSNRYKDYFAPTWNSDYQYHRSSPIMHIMERTLTESIAKEIIDILVLATPYAELQEARLCAESKKWPIVSGVIATQQKNISPQRFAQPYQGRRNDTQVHSVWAAIGESNY